MIEEIWKPVRGFEDWAEISNFGQIHYYATGKGRCPDERWTYGYESGDYLNACIGGVVKGVHVWVYLTFVGDTKGLQVNHIDENKHNNCVWNLNLMTRKENINWGTGNARRSAAHMGKKLSEETKAKIADTLRGMKQSPETIAKKVAAQKNNPKRSKAVQALDKNGNVVYEFPSTAEAGRQGFDASTVSKCCRGKLKSYKGFIWKYKE